MFRTIGMYFDPAAVVRFRNTLMGLVKHRGLATILTRLVVHEAPDSSIRVSPLVDPTVYRTYYLVECKNRFKKEETAVLEVFLKFELMAFEKLSSESV